MKVLLVVITLINGNSYEVDTEIMLKQECEWTAAKIQGEIDGFTYMDPADLPNDRYVFAECRKVK